MDIQINPSNLEGAIIVPSSKSMLHRYLIAAAFSKVNELRQRDVQESPSSRGIELSYAGSLSQDIRATLDMLSQLGAKIEVQEALKVIRINPIVQTLPEVTLMARESGTSLRLLLPLAPLVADRVTIQVSPSLKKRPLSDLIRTLKANGIQFESETYPLRYHGEYRSFDFEIPGNVSSQYLSGLMFLSLTEKTLRITPTTPVVSCGYLDLTLESLGSFHVTSNLDQKQGTFFDLRARECIQLERQPVPKDAKPSIQRFAVEGDWSNAAFFIAAGLLGDVNSKVVLEGLRRNSNQGDQILLEILKNAGANIAWQGKGLVVEASALKAMKVDFQNIPDLFPILSLVASLSSGVSTFTGLDRLKLKESDRLTATLEILETFGVQTELEKDELKILGRTCLRGGTVCAHNDHRLVMMAAVAGLVTTEQVMIQGGEAVSKSYPTFFEDYKRLGGQYVILS